MKSEEAPIISVVIACYNQGIYLSDADFSELGGDHRK